MASFGGWDSRFHAWPPSPAPLPSAPTPSLPERPSADIQYGSYTFHGQPNSGHSQAVPPAGPGYYYGQPALFPLGTVPEVVRAFQMVDRDGSGFIDENELRLALSTGYQRFNARTIRLLMFLFRNPRDPLRVGPKEFVDLWTCLMQWRDIFERFDRDRSGKIDVEELRDALYSIGYALPPSVLQVLMSRYDDGSSCRRRVELSFDSFIECGMIVKGLTDKFKEKDARYKGSVTLDYDAFLSMIIPFLVSYD
ncbi:hypothetical protein SAY87_012989 [Trapa incisa]|uniref:EF-hand domain-containing protein n=1 Tax=Trapa incisa TaxID=236973 RepID=A0AAN7KGB6_9MYRT|nr:hypothetical protein SAY87_012989 [Trapa incisa]